MGRDGVHRIGVVVMRTCLNYTVDGRDTSFNLLLDLEECRLELCDFEHHPNSM
jgi:hypothetical protein